IAVQNRVFILSWRSAAPCTSRAFITTKNSRRKAGAIMRRSSSSASSRW
uniref:Uncharacterized protein n=1 Tax=Pygocentrus nattereri TaxID=42514 RepID=A0A3B4BSC6_PYGNA